MRGLAPARERCQGEMVQITAQGGRMRHGGTVLVAALALCAQTAPATEHPVGGDVLKLRDPATASGRRAQFRASQDSAIAPGVAVDPRSLGATVEITGTGPGDGASGSIDLAPAMWTGLGKPKGSKGYVFSNRAGTNGVRKIAFKSGKRGGTLAVTAKGATWPYAVTQPQGPISVRFTVGSEVYCARFTTFEQNIAGRVTARNAAPPANCGGAPAACGNGVIEGSEQCDDHNTADGDGCSSTCQVENPSCGDGVATGTEECDDGNTTNGDGCSALCQLENRSAVCAGVPSVAGTVLTTVRIASGLASPLHGAAPPLDPSRLFILEQAGRIRIIKNGALSPTPFLDLGSKIACCGERGLLGLAFHPDYETNHRFFVYYTNAVGSEVIARYESTDADTADITTEKILLTIPHPGQSNHNGGQLAFGSDGYLYAGTGDGGGGGDPFENAQNGGVLLGKLLRLDVDRETSPYYNVPATNPFVGAGDPRDEIWALGLRNPWRFSFDRLNGDLYLGDVGQGDWEEVDVAAAGAAGLNYGWDNFEGNHCFEGPCPVPPTGFTMPVLEYGHVPASPPACGGTVIGGFVYRGCRMPALHGTYFFADFCTDKLSSFTGVSGGAAQNVVDRTAELTPGGGLSIDLPAAFAEDARGEIYIIDYDGEVYQIVPAS